MITCNIKYLQARCDERGYSLEEVQECIVSRDGDNVTIDINHPSYPKVPKPGFEKSKKEVLDTPSFLEKAKNFAKAATQHVASGMPIASDEEIERRFSICQNCEFLKDNACSKCGCPIVREQKFISKLSWADQKCPDGRW